MAEMEETLESSDPDLLNYTIVRPCGLTLGEKTGNYKVEEGQCNTGTTSRITRADVADFMLKTLESNEYDRKGFAIAGLWIIILISWMSYMAGVSTEKLLLTI